jgi:hypothetical protein
MSKEKEQVTTNGRAVFYAVLWEDFRKAALNCGWAIALHGSMASDMDMMAMPWTKDASNIDDLILALSDCIDGTIWKSNHFKPSYGKPFGRIVYTLSIFKDFYIDLSIMPFSK